MTRSLPVRPSLESIKKQAKALLRAYRAGDAEAASRVGEHSVEPSAFTSLRDAQSVVAREYGHADWAALRAAVEKAVAAAQPLAAAVRDFLEHACLTYRGEEDSPERFAHAALVLAERPEVSRADVYAAAACGDVEALRGFIEADPACVSTRGGPHRWVPVLYLAYARIADDPPRRDSLAAARLLLDHGADPDASFVLDDTYHFSALTGALGDGEGSLVRSPRHQHARELAVLLLKAGADPNDPQGIYNTHFTPGTEWLELLIAHGLTADARVDWSDDLGPEQPMRTLDWLLGRDVVSGNADRVTVLLAHGADPNAKDHYNRRTCYENALLYGRSDLVDLLQRHGAEPPALDLADRYRAACMSNDEAAARALVAEHPDLTVAAGTVTEAILHGSDVAARLLIDRIADPAERDANGTTPLHRAAISGKAELCELLVGKGAALEIRDRWYDGTPVGWAAQNGHDAIREWLLDRTHDVFDLVVWGRVDQVREVLARDGSQASRRRAQDITPLHCVTSPGELGAGLIDLLLAHGAEMNAKTETGETPLDLAQDRGHAEVAELLRARGAEPG